MTRDANSRRRDFERASTGYGVPRETSGSFTPSAVGGWGRKPSVTRDIANRGAWGSADMSGLSPTERSTIVRGRTTPALGMNDLAGYNVGDIGASVPWWLGGSNTGGYGYGGVGGGGGSEIDFDAFFEGVTRETDARDALLRSQRAEANQNYHRNIAQNDDDRAFANIGFDIQGDRIGSNERFANAGFDIQGNRIGSNERFANTGFDIRGDQIVSDRDLARTRFGVRGDRINVDQGLSDVTFNARAEAQRRQQLIDARNEMSQHYGLGGTLAGGLFGHQNRLADRSNMNALLAQQRNFSDRGFNLDRRLLNAERTHRFDQLGLQEALLGAERTHSGEQFGFDRDYLGAQRTHAGEQFGYDRRYLNANRGHSNRTFDRQHAQIESDERTRTAGYDLDRVLLDNYATQAVQDPSFRNFAGTAHLYGQPNIPRALQGVYGR